MERLGDEATDKLLERLPLTPIEKFATTDDIAALRGELLGEMGILRGEFGTLRAEFGDLRAEIADKMRFQTWYMAGLLLSGIGGTAAVVSAIVG